MSVEGGIPYVIEISCGIDRKLFLFRILPIPS